MNYEQLVKALRCCATCDCDSEKCKYIGLGMGEEVSCIMAITKDAAAAIEELQAQLMYATDAAKEIAEKVPKRGKWELIDGVEPMRWGCSRCKYLSWGTSNYCPRCGANMEVQDGQK